MLHVYEGRPDARQVKVECTKSAASRLRQWLVGCWSTVSQHTDRRTDGQIDKHSDIRTDWQQTFRKTKRERQTVTGRPTDIPTDKVNSFILFSREH